MQISLLLSLWLLNAFGNINVNTVCSKRTFLAFIICRQHLYFKLLSLSWHDKIMTQQIGYTPKCLQTADWKELLWAGLFKENIWGFCRTTAFLFPLQKGKTPTQQTWKEYGSLLYDCLLKSSLYNRVKVIGSCQEDGCIIKIVLISVLVTFIQSRIWIVKFRVCFCQEVCSPYSQISCDLQHRAFYRPLVIALW